MGAVVIVPQETVLDPVRFGQLLLDEGVTTMFMTIGLFHQYADVLAEPLSRLKYLLTGGRRDRAEHDPSRAEIRCSRELHGGLWSDGDDDLCDDLPAQ